MFEVDNVFALTAVMGLGLLASILIFYLIVHDLFPADKIWGLKWVIEKMKKSKAKNFVNAALSDVNKATITYNANQLLMEEVNGDRAYFLQLHNGGKSPTGKSYRYATCKYEVVSTHTSRKSNLIQRFPIEDMPYFFDVIMRQDENEMSKWRNTSDITDVLLRNYCDIHGIQSLIGFLVFSKSGDPMLYCMEWIHSQADDFCEEDVDAYRNIKQKVQSIADTL